MSYVLSVIRNDPWVFFGLLTAFASVASTMASGGLGKRLGVSFVALLLAFGATAGLANMMNRVEAKGLKVFRNASLTGSFSAKGKPLGDWSATPSRCLDGKERGFEGMLFVFEEGPVREIHIDTTRKKNNAVIIHLDDDKGSAIRVREKECEFVEGTTHASNVELNGRPMRRLKGNLQLSCPSIGLTGTAVFNGCLPESI